MEKASTGECICTTTLTKNAFTLLEEGLWGEQHAEMILWTTFDRLFDYPNVEMRKLRLFHINAVEYEFCIRKSTILNGL